MEDPCDQIMEDGEDDDGGEICDLQVKVGKLYVILGDSLEGYYVIKCSSLLEDTITGHYLKQITSSNTELTFKETKHVDKFFIRSVLSELLNVPDSTKTSYLAQKVDLDEILLKMVAMSSS